jgi:amidase
VGVAPTTGLVPRDGIIPLSNRQDTVGPLARTVKCAAHLLRAMAGRSAYDKATTSIPFESIPDYADACQGTRLDGLRIGVPREALPATENPVLQHFEQALKLLDATGATIVQDVPFSGAKEWRDWDAACKRTCLQAEFKHSIEGWLSELVVNPNNIHTLADMIAFTKSDPRECYPAHDIQRWEWIQDGPQQGSPAYKETLEKMYRLAGTQGITGAMDEYALDMLVFPTNIDPPTTFVARLGLPAITVPLGFYPGDTEPVRHRGDIVDVAPNVPSVSIVCSTVSSSLTMDRFGITFAGKAYTEEVLFRAAHVFEMVAEVQGKVRPYKMPTTELQDVVSEPHEAE